MRIRKRQVPLPLSSLSPAPVFLSDPHLINRSTGLVQLNRTSILPATTATSLTTTATAVAASISALPSPSKPSSSSCPQHSLSLSPLPTEDSIVGGSTSSLLDRQPSDHHQPQQPLGKATNGPDSSCHVWPHKRDGNRDSCLAMEDGKKQEKDKSNYSWEGAIVGSKAPSDVLPLSNAPQGLRAVDGRWCEGEKAFPLKKRRGSFESKVKGETSAMENNKKIKTSRMKTKMNNKCSMQNDIVSAPERGGVLEGEDKDAVAKLGVNVNRKRVRGTTLLEGSRCSRVNGRGWRCCQQTLVGYSLCEHHLGKGRLRSMTSVRSRSSLGSSSTASTSNTAPKRKKSMPDNQTSKTMSSGPSSSFPDHKQPPPATTSPNLGHDCSDVGQHEDHHDEDEKKPLLKTKKRMKLGMVKARSISSLLGQTNNDNVGSSAATFK